MSGSEPPPGLTIVPANHASWEDLLAIFGTRGEPSRCLCQAYKIPRREWSAVPREERLFMFRDQTDCGHPESDTTTGLVAYLDDVPVGWCAVEPRTEYSRLLALALPFKGRSEHKSDEGIWAVTCFVIRVGYRRRGISGALARAAVDFARQRGALALEGYAMMTHPEQDITWGELHVGSRSIFAAAGFSEVTHPSKRRFVMRIDFEEAAGE